MLSDATKQKMDEAIAAIAAEGHTICAVAISEDSFQPFSNLATTAEFVFNMISAAGVVAESIGADVSAIEEAQQNFQKQFIKIHEA
jgi:hypothetical protein